jgi:hypothetical protein
MTPRLSRGVFFDSVLEPANNSPLAADSELRRVDNLGLAGVSREGGRGAMAGSAGAVFRLQSVKIAR